MLVAGRPQEVKRGIRAALQLIFPSAIFHFFEFEIFLHQTGNLIRTYFPMKLVFALGHAVSFILEPDVCSLKQCTNGRSPTQG